MGKHSCWHWCLCHMDCMKTGQHLGVSTSGPDQKIEYKEEMWWFCCLLGALKNKTDSRTKLFLNEAYRIFPVLTLCSELRHLPRVLMWGFRCVCSQQRQNLPAETHGKVLSTHKGSQGSWQPQSMVSYATETKRIQQTCEGQHTVKFFLCIWLCCWILLIMPELDKNPVHPLLVEQDLQCWACDFPLITRCCDCIFTFADDADVFQKKV